MRFVFQVLGGYAEPGVITPQLHEKYHLPAFSPLPLHPHLCASRNAALWWRVRYLSQITPLLVY